MRDAALALARLDRADLDVVDAGAGTGFCTEGIVRHVAPERVTMVDQSPTSSPAPGASQRWRRWPSSWATPRTSARDRPLRPLRLDG